MSLLLDTDNQQEISEMNVTPFIDVMLVLLIIFMVVVPMATATIPLTLPVVNEQEQKPLDKPIVLSLDAQYQLFLEGEPLPLEQLVGVLEQKSGGNRETVIFLRVDKTVPYEKLMEIMNTLRQASFLKVGLVGQVEGG